MPVFGPVLQLAYNQQDNGSIQLQVNILTLFVLILIPIC